MSLEYNNYKNMLGGGSGGSGTTATGSYPYAAANTGTGNRSIWETLIGTTPGIIASTSSLITAFKADPNKIAEYTGGFNIINTNPNNTGRNNNWVWIAVGVLVLGAIAYFAFKGGK